MSYQERDYEIIDYELFGLPGTEYQLRGPEPKNNSPGEYFTCAGAAQTFGCFCEEPYPSLLAHRLDLPALNFGFAGAGPRFFLEHEALLNYVNEGTFAIVQVMSGRSEDNSLFHTGGREYLTRRSDGQQMGAEPAYRELLANESLEWVEAVVEETRANWVKSFSTLLEAIEVPTILFWFSKRSPDYEEGYSDVFALFGEFPQLVNRTMVERIRPLSDEYVECISTRGSPQRLVSRFTGEPASVAHRADLRPGRQEFNTYYPTPEMQADAADALAEACRRMPPDRSSGICISLSPPSITRTGILNPRLQSEREALAQEFQGADPFPHVAIPDFFSPEFCQRLLDDFPKFEERFATDERGRVGKKASRQDIRDISDAYREVDDFIQTPEFLGFMSEITGMPDLIYDPAYYGGGTHDNHQGQGLYVHVDFNYHPKGWHRRLNLIVYLNPEWEEEWGGSLELHSNPWNPATDRATSVLPLFNQAVLFETSEHSWHGYRQVNLPEDRRHLSRKSFAIYLYTKERPEEETAATHSTVYVPFGMPDDIRPEAVLSEEQYRLLDTRFDEYRDQLKAVYDQKQRAHEDLRAGHRLDLQGYAVQTRAPTGRWPDTWIASEFSMEFRATRPVRGLILEVSVPPRLEADQVLEIHAGDWSNTEEVPAGQTRELKLPISVDTGQSMEVAIRASATFSPANDRRELAYRIVNAVLEH